MAKLIINSIEIELQPSKPIARTLQVNDIATLNNRQANFTATFSIPKTANNQKAFSLLGIVGSNSNIPYQKNECYYYSDSGECLVYKGWAIISATAKDYKCNIYDGNIDLYKAIENTTLNALDLSDINHFKTLDNVIDSFNNLTVYKYILADYNGKALFDTNKINIDYLVPSVPVSWLWNKIFEFYGFTYSGSVFDTFNFQNLYMTFPKGITGVEPEEDFYTALGVAVRTFQTATNVAYNNSLFVYVSGGVGNFQQIYLQQHFKVTDAGYYRILMTGTATSKSVYGGNNTTVCNTHLVVAFNQESVSTSIGNNNLTGYEVMQNGISLNTTINVDHVIYLNAGDSFCILFRRPDLGHLAIVEEGITLEVKRVFESPIDFSGAFLDFKTKDFLNEVLTRFGLTPFKDKYSNNYKFLTLYELLQNNDVVDWSSKFIEQTNESYVYGNYAQKNDLTYKYNDNESDYYNGSLLIGNVNLADNKKVVNSNIYAPEKLRSNELPKQTNVYKLWNKEVKDDGSVTYKSLDKRFYFMRSDNHIFESPVYIGSKTLTTETTIGQAPFESFFKLPFNDIVQDYYLPMYQILNKSRVIDANIFLNEQDVINIDFSKLYWIEQLNSYFILNKINNFTQKGITKVELIKVDYVNTENNTEPIFETVLSYEDGCFNISPFTSTIENPIYFNFSYDGGLNWEIGAAPILVVPSCGYSTLVPVLFRLIRFNTGEIISNTIEVTL
jgi:hypothetical protein